MRHSIQKSTHDDLQQIRALLRSEKGLPFLPLTVLQDAVASGELLVSKTGHRVVGVVRYHHRKDAITTIHELVIAPEFRLQGIGRLLIYEIVRESQALGQTVIRLKCPLDLPANGFYSRLGFRRVNIEQGKRSALVVWEYPLSVQMHRNPNLPSFFLSLTHEASETRKVIRLWDESGDERDPFTRVVFTPLFSKPSAIALIHQLKQERGSLVMFDSGGYQVQMGKTAFEELFDRLLHFYLENTWADWYVLPDHVPRSTDTDREVEFKVRETLDFARLFLRMMPSGFAAKAVGVTHGRTEEQIRRCVQAYAEMGVGYLGFGSFGTSGPNGTVNLVSKRSMRLLHLLQTLATEAGLRFHIFGIGSPSHLNRLANAGIVPDSFDSAGWWKAGGFGNVFFPAGLQLHVTSIPTAESTRSGLQREKKRSGHECAFCSNPELLRSDRMMRILHNLAAMLDTVAHTEGGKT